MTTLAALGPNESLIDERESRARLITPALVLDLDAMERNIATMAAYAAEQGVAFRPHAKTHKSVQIARRQLDAGALGICCATLGEAEALAAGGIDGLLVTSPIVAPAKINRLMALRRDHESLMVTADDMDNLRALESAAAASGFVLDVVIDVDVGLHRTGTRDAETAAALAEAADESVSLRFCGLQGYAGHVQHIEDFGDRRTTSHGDLAPLRDGPRPARRARHRGAHRLGCRHRHPRYRYGDRADDRAPGSAPMWSWTSSISMCRRGTEATGASSRRSSSARPWSRRATTEVPPWMPASSASPPTGRCRASTPACPSAPITSISATSTGRIVFAGANERLAIGAALECIVPHCDPTVNLYDHYHCVRGETLVDIWPIEGRGPPLE